MEVPGGRRSANEVSGFSPPNVQEGSHAADSAVLRNIVVSTCLPKVRAICIAETGIADLDAEVAASAK